MTGIKKWLYAGFCGICIGIGVGFILYGNIGSDTVSVFQDGLHVVLDISYGQASRLYNVVLIAVALLFAGKYLGIGTIISAMVTGFAIDITMQLLAIIRLTDYPMISYILFFIGQTIYTIGLALLISCNFGMNALDSILYALKDLMRVDYKILRLFADFMLTLVGWLMGGVFGIGTVMSILFTGSMIQFFLRTFQHGFEK